MSIKHEGITYTCNNMEESHIMLSKKKIRIHIDIYGRIPVIEILKTGKTTVFFNQCMQMSYTVKKTEGILIIKTRIMVISVGAGEGCNQGGATGP